MNFTTTAFLAFLLAATVAYRLCPARFRAALLAAVSYGYYCTWSRPGALLLLVATGVVFLAARAIGAARQGLGRRAAMLASLSGLLLLLVAFKLMPLLGGILHRPIWVPLGISYYTFKLISYLVDVYWEKVAPEEAFIPFAAYVAFFPQIVAGPIQRANTLLPQIHKAAPATWSNVVWGLQRILLGFFKKFLVADNLSILVNFVYSHVHDSGTPLVLGLYAYPLQLYADFSGLTDIAVGAAWMLGVESPENFNAPFSAPSPSEFWRRWHMTLTTILMDYVYTPVRMAVRDFGNAGLVLSLFVTMSLIGLWHGFRWTYALFGLVQAAYLSVDALTSRARRRYYKAHPAAGRVSDWFGPVATFHLVAFSLVFFRAQSVRDALYMLRHISWSVSANSGEFAKLLDTEGRAILIGLCAYLLIEIADYLRRHGRSGEAVNAMPPWGRWMVYYCTMVTAVVLILLLLGTQVPRSTFVYAMF